MTTRTKILTAVAVSLAAPAAAALVVPTGLVAALGLAVPFMALAQLEGATPLGGPSAA